MNLEWAEKVLVTGVMPQYRDKRAIKDGQKTARFRGKHSLLCVFRNVD